MGLMKWFKKFGRYGRAKNKLKVFLYDIKKPEDVKKAFDDYVIFVNSLNLDNEDKITILNDAKNEFKKKAMELRIEEGFIDLFTSDRENR